MSMDTDPPAEGLPAGFHRRDPAERRAALTRAFGLDPGEAQALTPSLSNMELAEVMIESAVGCAPVPLGVATGFLIDGRELAVPMAVEEPSVIAAASYAARLLRRDGGFTTWAAQPVMSAQLYIQDAPEGAEERVAGVEDEARAALSGLLASLERRGGGFRGMRARRLRGSGTLRVDLLLDVRDAMGANILNTAAEALRPLLERTAGGRVLMAILTNQAAERLAGARFSIPAARLAARLPAGMSPEEAARRVAAASELAQEDPARAVTHNKGIMNGITSLALATMNDTRAVEAAAHAWACRDGAYRGLSRFRVEGGVLTGELELPLALAAAGGSVGFHPAARGCLKVMGNPDAPGLARIAAALGLAQNFAAVLALVTTGIQAGHMRLHAARLAYEAGARGADIRRVADQMSREGSVTRAAAQALLRREGRPG
jgi:hydroxymethylglutaryl-CoA reductase